MKAINKDDLIIVLNAIKDRSILVLDDLETILDRFGDEYFVEGCEFVRATESQKMAALRSVTSSRENGGQNMDKLAFLQAKKAKADILAMLKAHDLKFDISCDHKLMRYVITLIKEVNNREYKISFSCPYHMYDLLQDSVKVDYMKDAILAMIQLLNERIEKWPDEDTPIIYDYDGRISSHENVNE